MKHLPLTTSASSSIKEYEKIQVEDIHFVRVFIVIYDYCIIEHYSLLNVTEL